jgi:hypothetical protein
LIKQGIVAVSFCAVRSSAGGELKGELLAWNNWGRSEGCREWMKRTTFNKWTYTDIFYEAMELLFLARNGERGLLYEGKLLDPAKAVIKENKGRMYGFDYDDLYQLVEHGRFKYDTGVHALQIQGPDEGDIGRNKAGGYNLGRAGRGIMVEFNFYNHIKVAKECGWHGREGKERLVWLSASVMLHEIIHNHGFSHPEKTSFKPGSDYASSLPMVAQLAVLRQSPYWSDFESLFSDSADLALSGKLMCGS